MVRATDTNVLVRLFTRDDVDQASRIDALLEAGSILVIPLVAICEFAWVLRSRYKLTPEVIAAAVREILSVPNISADFDAIKAGLAVLDAGGDFADGVIAYEGRQLGGAIFLSFDRNAVSILTAQGYEAVLI